MIKLQDCPLCSQTFTPNDLPVHASTCTGPAIPDVNNNNSNSSAITTLGTANHAIAPRAFVSFASEEKIQCPICNLFFSPSVIVKHADACVSAFVPADIPDKEPAKLEIHCLEAFNKVVRHDKRVTYGREKWTSIANTVRRIVPKGVPDLLSMCHIRIQQSLSESQNISDMIYAYRKFTRTDIRKYKESGTKEFLETFLTCNLANGVIQHKEFINLPEEVQNGIISIALDRDLLDWHSYMIVLEYALSVGMHAIIKIMTTTRFDIKYDDIVIDIYKTCLMNPSLLSLKTECMKIFGSQRFLRISESKAFAELPKSERDKIITHASQMMIEVTMPYLI